MSVKYAIIPRISFFIIISFLPVSCLNDKLGDNCEATYYSAAIKPFLISNCANSIDCHMPGGASGVDYTKYNEVFIRKDEIIRRLSLDPADPDFMPNGGQPVSPQDLQMIKDWVADGAKGCD